MTENTAKNLSYLAISVALIMLFLIIGMCSSSKTRSPSPAESNYKKTFQRGSVSCSDKYNLITTYAVFIGRAAACRENFDEPMKYVGTWIDSCFEPRERAVQLAIFAAGVKFHAENQRNGNSPDSCSSVAKTFYSVTWPDFETNKVEPQQQTNQSTPYKLEDLPYIDKAKGIDTTIKPQQ